MLLTCPTCRSGLEVPDGTTALVRCPACKTVFSPATGLAPELESEEDPEAEEVEDDRPRRKKPAKAIEKSNNRDFEPGYFDEKPTKKRRRFDESSDGLSSAERASLRAAFTRAAWGCKLIWISFALFMLSMTLIGIYWFQFGFAKYNGLPSPTWVIAAGAIGLVYWILAVVGIGLCMSGPSDAGHWEFGIAAAVAAALHLILLAVLAAQSNEIMPGAADSDEMSGLRWRMIATQLDTLGFSLTFVVYHGEDIVPKKVGLLIAVGLAELVRNILILMLLSCLARAAGDKDLSHQCTRAAGYASFGPGILSLVMLAISIATFETNGALFKLNDALFKVGATINPAATVIGIIYMTATMGVYAILMGMMLPALMVSREVADACEEPFQANIPKL